MSAGAASLKQTGSCEQQGAGAHGRYDFGAAVGLAQVVEECGLAS